MYIYTCVLSSIYLRGHLGLDHMVVGFTTTYAISAYHHWCCEFESWSGRGVQHYEYNYYFVELSIYLKLEVCCAFFFLEIHISQCSFFFNQLFSNEPSKNLLVTCDRSMVFRFPPPIITDRHNITEILLKVALNTIKPNQIYILYIMWSIWYLYSHTKHPVW
jgi:hypothetical protein